MRLLFLSPVGVVGGAERVLLTAVAGIRRAEPSAVLRVIVPHPGPLAAAAEQAGAEVDVVPMPAAISGIGDSALRSRGKWSGRVRLLAGSLLAVPAGLAYISRLRTAVRRFAPDVVHSNGIKTHLLARLTVPRRTPVVWHLHDFYSLRPLAARLLRRVRGRVAAGIAISRAVAADAAATLPGVPVEVIPNALDLARFSPGTGDNLDELAGTDPAPPGAVRIGLVATYAKWKGHLVFLDAARRLAAEAPHLPIRWYVIGGPIYHTTAQFTGEELRAAAAERGVADRVRFVPFLPDPSGAYRALDVVVHASTLPEPFGLTVAEAMACGRAVVVSAAGGAAELFTDGRDGFGAPPGDAAALASAVGRLAEDPALREQLGANARATAAARFDDTRYGPQLLDLLRRHIPLPLDRDPR
jgi:glycosyltransferase involved in cell wall biosynthesis